MGFLDAILKRNSELASLFDFEIFEQASNRIHMKKLALDTCASFLGRTISQSEFRIKENGKFTKDELYYRLNVRPNKNMTASTFWQTVISKWIYDNECLIIQADDGDLLIADDFEHNSYAVLEDTFFKVRVKDYEFKRLFRQSEVLHLKHNNEKLAPLVDSLFTDYGELFGRLISSQKRKNQIRGTVDMDALTAKSEEGQKKLQAFIDKMYKAFETKEIAIVPQQPGIKYNENSGAVSGQSVDEINKVTDGFLSQVAMAMGIPVALLKGDMADVEKNTKNYMMFTVKPLLKKIKDEADFKFIEKGEYLRGKRIEIKTISYHNLFDIAASVDKLVSSGAFTGNEIRLEAGYEPSSDPKLDKHYITKNYTEMDSNEGGENE
ncbi:portal protein [Bacillus phage vB_BhaS-171]|uniref:portal protein n=1 Tax=Bacillus phage vB_BhaS-171 TaxID=1775140 RepID=UPI0007448EF7|nr:portal protein [Bacillus phage vB_BhaS-171]ALY08063.1 portal protein [Bacillus phage vB_BhaS-171]